MHLVDLLSNDTPLRRYFLFAFCITVPTARIMMRAGFNAFWAMLLAVPYIGWILCAVFLALRKWPRMKGAAT